MKNLIKNAIVAAMFNGLAMSARTSMARKKPAIVNARSTKPIMKACLSSSKNKWQIRNLG